MSSPSPNSGLMLRWVGILSGVITFIWLPVEDQSVLFLILLSLIWSAWLAVWWFNLKNPTPELKRILLAGAGGGALVFPIAIVLTLLKAGLHNHGFLDFSSTQLSTVAQTIPLWIALGVIVSMLWLKYHPEDRDW